MVIHVFVCFLEEAKTSGWMYRRVSPRRSDSLFMRSQQRNVERMPNENSPIVSNDRLECILTSDCSSSHEDDSEDEKPLLLMTGYEVT